MEAEIAVSKSKKEIIEVQAAKLERVLLQVQPSEAIEIIRYGKTTRVLVSHTFKGGDLEAYARMVKLFFADVCEALREGQNLRIQLMRG